jgi:modulator of FtsH protease
MSQLSASEKLFGSTTLSSYKSVMVKKTYALLTISVLAALAGGYIGVTNYPIIRFFSGFTGWIMAMVLINAIPRVGIWASRQANKSLALLILGLDGFVSGIVLAPLLYYAEIVALNAGTDPNELIWAAMGVTATIFLAVSGYIFLSRQRFSAPGGLIIGMFFVLVAATALNFWVFPNLGGFGMLISVGIGIMGLLMLIYATSSVLHDPNFLNPFVGALMLFSALFNIFVSTLNVILRLFNGGRQ